MKLELFKDALLAYQIERAHGFANQINDCQNIRPELIEVLLDYKTDIFFYKHFLLYRDKLTVEKHHEKAFKLYENAVLDKWADYFELKDTGVFVRKFNKFLSEHFLLSISLDTYTHDWVENYIIELLDMVREMNRA